MVTTTLEAAHAPLKPLLLFTHGVTPAGDLHLDPSSSSPLQEQHPISNPYTRTLLLNRPLSLHALTPSIITSLSARLSLPSPSLFLLSSTPAKRPTFSAGGDVLSIRNQILNSEATLADHMFRVEFRLDYNMTLMKTPVIALINGIVMGGGAGLAVHSTFQVATEKSVFAMPEAAIGLVPDVGASFFLSRMRPPGLGMYLALTGGTLKGSELLEAGIASHYVSEARIPALVSALQNRRVQGEAAVRKVLAGWMEDEEPREGGIPGLPVMERCFTAGSVEEIVRRLEGEAAMGTEEGQFARRALERLSRMSPMSLKATFETQRRGKEMSLDDCLRMEFRVITRCIRRSDFIEGTRAVLIEKGSAAKWKPARLADVRDQDVAALFEPLETDLKIAELALTDKDDRLEEQCANKARL
eukprot:GFKZ01009977.1.p1 GENE.GFKZ01009977.1~~GFKZ01009977.1.p1  ORF type:complete len:414 (-),score=77.93 GFKZ01009977.1:2108-3349(-)